MTVTIMANMVIPKMTPMLCIDMLVKVNKFANWGMRKVMAMLEARFRRIEMKRR